MRRPFWRAAGVVASIGLLAACSPAGAAPVASASTVRVGILHSLTGPMAVSDVPLVDAEKMAIEEINAAGGVTVDGTQKKIDSIVDDGESDPDRFAAKAEELVDRDNVPVVFGGWSSAARAFEEEKALLFYPVRYVAAERSPNVYYTGATPDQQLVPALEYLKAQGRTRLYLVGTDDAFPRETNTRIKAYAAAHGLTVVGEQYRPPGSADFAATVARLTAAAPDAVVNTVGGDSNAAFFAALEKAGVKPTRLPVLSVSVTEQEVRAFGPEAFAGHLVAANYFQTTKGAANEAFVSAYQAKYGDDKVTSDPMEAAYTSVHLWAKAVTAAGSTDPDDVRRALAGLTFDAPEGRVTVDGTTRCVRRTARIGVIGPDGRITEV